MRRTTGILAVLQLTGLLLACSANPDDAITEEGSLSSGAAAVPVTSRTELLANNTSASSTFQDLYTPAARFNGASIGVVSNGGAPVPAATASSLEVGAVSKVSTRSLLYPGSATKIFVETQSWFCTKGAAPLAKGLGVDQCGSHIDIGYDANTNAHVQREVNDMISRGIDGVIADWSGQSAGKGVVDAKSADVPAINTGTLVATMKAAEASKGKFEFSVMEDEGVRDCAQDPKCNITDQLISDLDFLAANFYPSSAYYRVNGRPVVYFFNVDGYATKYGKTISWSDVRAKAKGSPLFVFENAGAFGHDDADGAYSWLSPADIGAYPGKDPFGITGYLPDYYARTAGHSLVFASAYKGFDDHVVNGWSATGNGRRYIGQQCGKTWLDTFAEANKHYSTSKPLTGMQLVTWDDYEEGSELETGIENYAQINTNVSGSKLTWSVTRASNAAADCVNATNAGFDIGNTIHHYAVYAATGSGDDLALVADNLPSSTRSLDLTGKLPSGSGALYVYAVGKPSIRNHLSGSAPPGAGAPPSDGDCTGVPTILEPTVGEAVGPWIHIRTSSPSCIQTSIAYIDGDSVVAGTGALDKWVNVSMGPHTLNVNGWAGSDTAHASSSVTFKRTY